MLEITRECQIDKHIFPEENKSSKCLNCPSIRFINNSILPIISDYETIHESGRYDGRHVWGVIKKDDETLYFIHDENDKYIWEEVDGLVYALPLHIWTVYKVSDDDIQKVLKGEIYSNRIENKEFRGYIVEQEEDIFLKEWYRYYDWTLYQQADGSNIYTWAYDELKEWLKPEQWENLNMKDRLKYLQSKANLVLIGEDNVLSN